MSLSLSRPLASATPVKVELEDYTAGQIGYHAPVTLDVMKGVLRKLSIRPFPCPRLRLGDLFARHAFGDHLAGLAGTRAAGRGGKV